MLGTFASLEPPLLSDDDDLVPSLLVGVVSDEEGPSLESLSAPPETFFCLSSAFLLLASSSSTSWVSEGVHVNHDVTTRDGGVDDWFGVGGRELVPMSPLLRGPVGTEAVAVGATLASRCRV